MPARKRPFVRIASRTQLTNCQKTPYKLGCLASRGCLRWLVERWISSHGCRPAVFRCHFLRWVFLNTSRTIELWRKWLLLFRIHLIPIKSFQFPFLPFPVTVPHSKSHFFSAVPIPVLSVPISVNKYLRNNLWRSTCI